MSSLLSFQKKLTYRLVLAAQPSPPDSPVSSRKRTGMEGWTKVSMKITITDSTATSSGQRQSLRITYRIAAANPQSSANIQSPISSDSIQAGSLRPSARSLMLCIIFWCMTKPPAFNMRSITGFAPISSGTWMEKREIKRVVPSLTGSTYQHQIH